MKNFEQFATENKGVFRIGSVDCEDFQNICKKEGVEQTPVVKLYPPFPAPTTDYDTFDQKVLKKAAGKYYQDKSIEITQNNHKTFV